MKVINLKTYIEFNTQIKIKRRVLTQSNCHVGGVALACSNSRALRSN